MTVVTFPQLIQRACGIDVHLKVVVRQLTEQASNARPAHSKPSRVL